LGFYYRPFGNIKAANWEIPTCAAGTLWLAITPEGTRGKVEHLQSSF